MRNFLPNIIPVIVSGLVLTGLGGAFTAIISYEEMSLGFYKEQKNEGRDLDTERVNDLLAGLFRAAQSTGMIMGPMLGSYMTIYLKSFRKCSDIMALITVAFMVLMILCVLIPAIVRNKRLVKKG
jgi:MFS family permease